jgi:hypothetical protein
MAVWRPGGRAGFREPTLPRPALPDGADHQAAPWLGYALVGSSTTRPLPPVSRLTTALRYFTNVTYPAALVIAPILP